jgi:hypothetical protein
MRQIRDAAGIEWMVYEVNPTSNPWAALESLPEGYRAGWLCFESATEKRRLTPAPAGWEQLPLHALDELLGTAVQVQRPSKQSLPSATPPIQTPRAP